MIRGLDDDDIDHLDLVDKKRLEEEKLQRQEELKELREYREKVAAMQEENEDKVGILSKFSEYIEQKFVICRKIFKTLTLKSNQISYFIISETPTNRREIPKSIHREIQRSSIKTDFISKVTLISCNQKKITSKFLRWRARS